MGYEVPVEPPEDFGADCAFCEEGKTPKYLTVSFSGFIECTNCIWGGPGDFGYKFLGAAAILNAGKFLLTQTGIACKWIFDEEGVYGRVERWVTDDPPTKCDVYFDFIEVTDLKITVVKTGPATIAVEIIIYFTRTIFTFTGDVSDVLTGCMKTSAIDNDLGLPCASWGVGGVWFCRGGTMKIREGDWT